MELTNKRVQYTVSNESENIKITGEVTVGDSNNSFNGTVNTLNGDYSGNFYFNEIDANNVNLNFNNVPADKVGAIYSLIQSTMTEVKATE